MKISSSAIIAIIASSTNVNAFSPSLNKAVSQHSCVHVTSTALEANIRGPTDKSEELRFGWDGTTPLGGAVEVAAPARMLSEIREAGETIPDACELFNANLEMSGDDITFEEVMELIDEHYESQLLEFANGDMVNQQGENEGSAKVLSYAALSDMDKETTLKLWGQYYRDVVASPEGTDHQNIRNFMKTGWDGVPFENGIALTRKNVGEGEWDAFAESWMP